MRMNLRYVRPLLAVTLAGLVLAGQVLAQATTTSGLGLSIAQDKVAALEAQTKQAEDAVKQSAISFRESWSKLEAQGITADQARAAHEGKLEELPLPVRDALTAAEPSVMKHDATLAAYFAIYDQLSIAKMDLKVTEVIQDLEGTRDALRDRGGDVPPLDKALKDVRAAASKYWDARAVTTGPESFKRLYALRDLSNAYRGAELQVKRVQVSLGDLPIPKRKSLLSRVRAKIKNVATSLRLKASMAPKVARIVAYLARPVRKPDPERLSELVRELGETYTTKGQIKIEAIGQQNIPAGKKLIFTPSHRQGEIDSLVLVQLMPGNFTPLMTFRYYPEWAKPLLNKVLKDEPGLIPVDLPNVDVVDRAVQSVKDGRALLIYPEGHVASPLGEIRPLRNGIERICEKLLDEDVALVPVSILDPVEGWAEPKYGSPGSELGMDVKIVFDKPVNPRWVYAMGTKAQNLLLNMIRENWHRNTLPSFGSATQPAGPVEKIEAQSQYREPQFEAIHGN